jgi:PAS domain S-box-containing protein
MLSYAPVSTETPFEEMKRYVRFDERDAEHLRAFREIAAPEFPRIAAEFYDRIREHEQAHEVFTGEEQVERLKRSLVRWMDRVCSGTYDEAYYAETANIGHVHVRVGLPQRYMFTAMALIRIAFEAIADRMGERGPGVRDAVGRILSLELAIMLEAYRDAYVARIQHAERAERAQIDRTLARTEHRYVSAVELARVLVVGLDAEGSVRLFNREAERVTGLGRDEVLGTPFVETLVPEPLRQEHGAIFASSIAGQPMGDVLESAVRTRAGKVRDVRWQLAYSPAGEGSHDEVVCFAIGQDVTDENALASRVRQAEKLAAVGTLAAGLAHEIRNPLNGAQLHVTFLERGLKKAHVQDPDTLEAVGVVREEIKRLSALVSEFLDFARPKPLSKQRVSLLALATHVSKLVAPDAEKSRAEVRLDLPSADILLDLDPARIEQVLLNLLRNAIDAVETTDGGAVILRVRRKPRHAVIEVEDEGPGLPSPEAPVFDAFFSTKPQGTGLGLAIAHRIVVDHEGAIAVESRPGRTVFRVTLPIAL